MQYTGLKDKNGKEPWEGDVVKCQDYDDAPDPGVIEYTEHNSAFMMINDPQETALFLYEAYHGCEVLGNVYENPELLNATLSLSLIKPQ